MRRQRDLRGLVSFALTGSLCFLLSGCGQGSGDEFRTYDQTVADVAPEDAPPEGQPAESDTRNPEQASGTVAPDGAGNSTADAPNSDTDAVEGPAEPESGTDLPEGPVAGTEPESADDDAAPTDEEAVADVSSDDTAPGRPRVIELLIPEKQFTTEGPDGALRVSYDDIDLLKVLNMDPVPRTAASYFPNWLNGLVGKRIRIRGFMYPPPIESGIPAFLLARDNQICCFGRNPLPYDIVPVILRDGVTTDYINGRPFDVAGVFHVGVEMDLDDPTKVKTVYYIDDAIVIDE